MLDLLSRYKRFIKSFHVSSYELEGENYRFKAEVTFTDDSSLSIKEYLFQNYERKYAYHWADSLGNLICRWDNARHWANTSTFPHHKHVGSRVLESTEISLEDVLARISESIEKEAGD